MYMHMDEKNISIIAQLNTYFLCSSWHDKQVFLSKINCVYQARTDRKVEAFAYNAQTLVLGGNPSDIFGINIKFSLVKKNS